MPYFHVVFTLPGAVADIAYQNKSVVYDLLLKTAAETLITIAPTRQSPWAEGPRVQNTTQAFLRLSRPRGG